MSERTINGVPIPLIVQAVEKIEAEEGLCHPARLVAVARAKRSPLHGLFEWDDTQAAQRWRVHQARNVLNSIRVVVEGVEESVPAYVHVSLVSEDGVANGYMASHRALSGNTRAGVLNDVLKQLRGLKRRHDQLTELSAVWDAIEEADERVAA